MIMPKKIVYALTGMAFCSLVLLGCSEDQGKKQEKKVETTQERLGREAAQNLQKPIEEARKTATQAGEKAGQAVTDAAERTNQAIQESSGGKEKKKLEGC